jgi:hypothetical protein
MSMTTVEPLEHARGQRRAYDHRLREQVCRRNLRRLPGVDIPRSTIKSWKRRGVRAVVALSPPSPEHENQAARIAKLEERARVLAAVVRLLLAVLRASGFAFDGERVPDGEAKAGLLRAIASAKPALTLAKILRIVRLSPSRYEAWRRRAVTGCGLDDRSSCPRSNPAQLTAAEVATVKDMVLDPAHRHMPVGTLARYAERANRLFASATTWARLIREHGWRRPRYRVHPVKPTVGIRASKPNEIWHIDVTILKLIDGTKAYIHAVVDNYSRKVLAWTVAARLDPTATCAVLVGIARARVELGRQRRLVHDYASASCWSTAAAVRRLRASTRTAS